jgi:hypothetical protein
MDENMIDGGWALSDYTEVTLALKIQNGSDGNDAVRQEIIHETTNPTYCPRGTSQFLLSYRGHEEFDESLD